MADNFDWSVAIDIMVKGAQPGSKDIDTVTDSVDELNRVTELSNSQLKKMTKAAHDLAASSKKAAMSSDEWAGAEQRLLKIQRDRAKVDAAESNRLMTSGIKARMDAAAAAEAEAAAISRVAQARNAERASASAGGGVASHLGGSSSAGRASDTGLAAQLRKEEAAAIAKGTTEALKSSQALKDEAASRKAELASLREAIQARNSDTSARDIAILKQREAESAREKELASLRATIQARHESSKAVASESDSLNSQRYALYEVAAAYTAVSAGLITLGTQATQAFAEMESGFTKVERTSGMYGDAFAPLEADILAVSRSIPTLTGEIQDLAARGAQMGIAADDVAGFAEVMAKFVATSPEVDVNSVAEAFGRLSNLTGTKDFEALASSIAQVGVNSAATDAQIIKTTQELARATSSTALTASEVVGLAAAFASLGVAPEAARGVMNQFFTQLEKGASGMNDSMAVAAQILGTTEQAAASLFKTDTGAFFQQFVTGLSGVEEITVALDAMGLQGQRLLPAFKALAADTERNAAGQSVLASAIRDANQGFAERTELDRQYAPIADDLNSKFTIMKNALMELAYTAGSEMAPAMKGVMDALIGAVQAATDFINSPLGGTLTRIAAATLAVVTAYATLRGAIALATAMMLAFSTAAGSSALSGLAGSLKNLIGLFIGTGNAATAGSVGVGRFTFALKALGRATVIGAVLQYVSEWIFNTGNAAVQAGSVLGEFANFLLDVGQAINDFFGWGDASKDPVYKVIRGWSDGLKSWGSDLQKANSGAADFASAWENIPDYVGDTASGLGDLGNNMGGASDSAQALAAEVRTVLDYASDLKGVFDRSFDLRFGIQTSKDDTTKILQRFKEEAEAAAQKVKDLRTQIRDLRADMGVLSADISTQKYFLSVAVEYGDTARAAAIQANLAKLQADLAKKGDDLAKANKDLTKAQDATSKSTSGNSAQAIKNRDTLKELVKSYQEQLVKMAESGASQEELGRTAERLRQDFIRQATQLGFSRAELTKYEKSFYDVATAIQRVPRNVTVEIKGMGPALAALREFEASVKNTMNRSIAEAARGAGGIGGALRGIKTPALTVPIKFQMPSYEQLMKMQETIRKTTGDARFRIAIPGGQGGQTFASGGYTGPGGKYEPAGIVHRGEYVVKKEWVNQRTGLPYADVMGKLTKGSQSSSYASGGYVSGGGGVGVVDLSAQSVQLIARAVQPYLVMDGRIVGEVASNSYAAGNRVGAN